MSMVGKLHIYKSLPSTNHVAFAMAREGALHGEVVWAMAQTAGRGRLGKEWYSPEGNGLYFSIILRPQLTAEEYPQITMTTGLAIAEILQRLCKREVMLKWPNDVYISNRKCCGVLAEASMPSVSSPQPFAIVGIGVNILGVADDFPPDLREKVTSLFLETGIIFDSQEVVTAISEAVLTRVRSLEHHGFRPILDQWRKRDFLRGKWLQWVTHSGKVIAGYAEGPDKNGQLLVRDKEGMLHEVISGDITLCQNAAE